MAWLESMMSTFFVPIGKEISDCQGTELLQSSLEAGYSESVLTFERRTPPESSNPRFGSFRKGRAADSAAPKPNGKPSPFQAATRVAIFCKVELVTSKSRT